MCERCRREKHPAFRNYGGRGIRVCERWLTFANFLADMGERPPGTSIDRLDSNRDYEPGNVRWATTAEQGDNRRTNRLLTFRGETLTIKSWSRRLGIWDTTLGQRLRAGWSVEEVLATPVGARTRWTR